MSQEPKTMKELAETFANRLVPFKNRRYYRSKGVGSLQKAKFWLMLPAFAWALFRKKNSRRI